MNDDDKQNLKERYTSLPDGTLLELLNEGEAGLVDGAYILVRDEALKRKLISSDFKASESKVTNVSRMEEPLKKKPKGWKYYLVMGLILSVTYSCGKTFWSWVDSMKTFNTGQAVNYYNSMSEKDRQENTKIQKELFEAMTADEKERYLTALDRIRRGVATKADVEQNGKMLMKVAERLPIGDRMEVVSFYDRRFN